MSFRWSEPPPWRCLHLAAAAVAALLATLTLAAPARAGEATGRGRKAIITWLDEAGVEQEADARDIRYVYHRRTFLRVPKEGKSYKDQLFAEKGIPFAQNFIRFSVMEKVEFRWEQAGEPPAPRLAIQVTLINGKSQSSGGHSLAGAVHPISPYISFTVSGAERRIDLNPLSTQEQRRGKPQLLSMAFYL